VEVTGCFHCALFHPGSIFYHIVKINDSRVLKVNLGQIMSPVSLPLRTRKKCFFTATKLGTPNKIFVAATKHFAAATKRFVDRTKHFVDVTKYFCKPYSFVSTLV